MNKFVGIFVVVLALAVAVAFYFREGGSGEEEKKGAGGGDPLKGVTTRKTGSGLPGRGQLPGIPGGGGVPQMPFGPMQSTEVMGEFVEEMGMSEREAGEFFEALKKSEEGLMEVAKIEEMEDGVPVPPDPEKFEAHVMERERLLTDELGVEGYRKFKAFTTTMPIRVAINGLMESREGFPMSSEQKREVLYGAFEELEKGEVPKSPQEMVTRLTDAVVEGASGMLAEGDQKRLADAIKKGMPGMPGAGGGAPGLPPGVPALPGGGVSPGPGEAVPPPDSVP